jgi:nucleoid-associated protein YgaU
VVLVVVLLLAAVAGGAVGVSLGTRQGGPLASEGGPNGRPTIVVATVVAVASVSPAPSAVAPTAITATQTQTQASASGQYVVQPGDTLRSIAQQQYGDAEQWPKIYQANRDVIGPDPDALKSGTTIQIPVP